jgi:catechol 2,3-dioxygenase-like lactoylglutathione lyase family enzyme
MNQHLHIVTLGVTDLETSRKFYVETLGWTLSRPQEGIVFFQAGGVVLALFPREELAKDAQIPADGD